MTGQRVFISYRADSPDEVLARQFYDSLEASGHRPFMAGESIKLGEAWRDRIHSELQQCDYFLLLLSERSATSEMVTEEVKRAQRLQEKTGGERPTLLPIRVKFSLKDPLNYELRGYLDGIQQREWTSEADTKRLLGEVQGLIDANRNRLTALLLGMVKDARHQGSLAHLTGSLNPNQRARLFNLRKAILLNRRPFHIQP